MDMCFNVETSKLQRFGDNFRKIVQTKRDVT